MKRLPAVCLLVSLAAVPLQAQPAGPTLTVPPNQALLIVRVPADAELRVGEHASTQRGPERLFLTPPLAVGNRYAYAVEARWTRDGQQKKVTRQVEFEPGQASVVDLTREEAAPVVADTPASPGEPKTRTFRFTYAGKVKDLPPGKEARVWLPMATSNAFQEVEVDHDNLPGNASINHDKTYGNAILSFVGKANDQGEIPFQVTYKVRRREVKTDVRRDVYLKPADAAPVTRFLEPDAKVPLSGKPIELLKEKLGDKPLPKDQFAAARFLYDLVNQHMTYKKVGTGWGQGDVLWACDSKYGNCTDFHSLFIAMARGNKIASKFDMGFPIPPERGSGPVGGYHCWAWFLPAGKGWIPVDISEANRNPALAEYFFGNLTEDRVQFTTGRDINLVPRQQGGPLNFFIYPYVEVDGKTYPAEKVERSFSYEDVSQR